MPFRKFTYYSCSMEDAGYGWRKPRNQDPLGRSWQLPNRRLGRWNTVAAMKMERRMELKDSRETKCTGLGDWLHMGLGKKLGWEEKACFWSLCLRAQVVVAAQLGNDEAMMMSFGWTFGLFIYGFPKFSHLAGFLFYILTINKGSIL